MADEIPKGVYKQERPAWCPHQDCIFKRRVMDDLCGGQLPEPQPHDPGGPPCNTHRICINAPPSPVPTEAMTLAAAKAAESLDGDLSDRGHRVAVAVKGMVEGLKAAPSVFDLQVNDADLEWLRWVFDALDGKSTSWLSKG